MRQMPHFVYIVRCQDGSLYTGYAKDPAARMERHNSGKGAKYTAGRRPVTLVFTQKFRSLSRALKREHELKQWTRAKKEALVSGSR
jgi:predicted GIY-YIG superfamily endonuclease